VSPPDKRQSGRSSGVEHNLAKVGVEGSNPFARSKSLDLSNPLKLKRKISYFLPVWELCRIVLRVVSLCAGLKQAVS
jgi:hypothetical protein